MASILWLHYMYILNILKSHIRYLLNILGPHYKFIQVSYLIIFPEMIINDIYNYFDH